MFVPQGEGQPAIAGQIVCVSAPQILAEVEVVQCVRVAVKQIVVLCATDHGDFGCDAVCGLVPQIMEKIMEVRS